MQLLYGPKESNAPPRYSIDPVRLALAKRPSHPHTHNDKQPLPTTTTTTILKGRKKEMKTSKQKRIKKKNPVWEADHVPDYLYKESFGKES